MTKSRRTPAEKMDRIMKQRREDMLFEHEVRKYFKKKGMPDPFEKIRGFKKGDKIGDFGSGVSMKGRTISYGD
tara:strand:- start:1534 stop:1752 length:219 start_codon:yes stop_codon:yes gene_type:complete